MIQTTNLEGQDVNILIEEFYDKKMYFSFSSGNLLLTAPKDFFFNYILKQREVKRDKYLVVGTLTHFLVLEGVDFREYFAIAPEGVPSGKGKEVIDRIFEICRNVIKQNGEAPGNEEYTLQDFKPEILEIMIEIDYYQNLKDDEGRFAKVIDEKNEDYFQFLMDSTETSKELVDASMIDLAGKAAEAIKEREDICQLLALNDYDENRYRVFNEFEHKMDLKDYPFGLKGRIDNLVVDIQEKVIYVNDLKTTSKTLSEFQESVEKWNYSFQACVYIELVLDCLKEHIDKSWKVVFHFVTIDKYNHIYAFPVSPETLKEWSEEYNRNLDKLKYHYEERKYELPYDFSMGNVTL